MTALVAQETLKGERQQTNHDVTNPLSQGVRKPTRLNSFMSESSGDEQVKLVQLKAKAKKKSKRPKPPRNIQSRSTNRA